MGNIVKQILGGLWQVFTYRNGWVKPIKNSLPVAAFLAIIAMLFKTLGLFAFYTSYSVNMPLSFAFLGISVELVAILLGIGLIVLVAGKRKLYPTVMAGMMYFTIVSVFVGVAISALTVELMQSASFTLGQARSLFETVQLLQTLWFASLVCALLRNALNEPWWRAALMTLLFMATSAILMYAWQQVFFPQIV